MNRFIHLTWFAALAELAFFLAAAPAGAQASGRYELSWSTLDGGGVTRSSGGRYELAGTIGQPDAGRLEGGRYSLAGGFWTGGPAASVPLPPISAAAALVLCIAAHLLASRAGRIRAERQTGRKTDAAKREL